MSKVIVTGAWGYLGRHVVRALANRGVEIIAVTRGDYGDELPGIELLKRDLWSVTEAEWSSIAPGSILIHLAWRDGFRHDSDAHMSELSRHYNLVRTLADVGMTRYVSIGSMHEVGPVEGLISEDIECRPVSQYGIAKNALRLSTTELCNRLGISMAWLRCFYILGDDARNHSVFTKILERSAAGDEAFPLTSGAARFDFIQVEELGRLVAEVALSGYEGVLNLGSGQVRTLREQIERFVAENSLAIRMDFGAFPERNGISVGAWPDLERLRKLQQNSVA